MARTVEHLLAALVACAITDVDVELDAEELPILDGSAQPWIDLLAEAGRVESDQPMEFLEITAPIEWRAGRSHLCLEPAVEPGFELTVSMDLRDMGAWSWSGTLTPEVLRREIVRARSFGRVRNAIPAMLYGYLTGRPILRGARPGCTAAILGNKVIGGTRMPDEFVRHRVLDLIGDLALLGAPILGRLDALRPGHQPNFHLMTTLMARPDAWRRVVIA
jgi:UDP-3-O-[3-hydroxymyristoyl] N-acetylglucosamine deacetylase